MDQTQLIGARGERAAVEWLRANGFLIAERNWRCPPHELDIVAISPDGHYHFVEVKTRHSGSLTTPHEALTRRKISFLIKAANHYIEQHAITAEVWIDFIAVTEHDDGALTTDFVPDVAGVHW